MDAGILESTGLSPSEIAAYIAAVELGSTVASLIARKANLNRSNCYEALKRLISKGLVTSVNKNRKTFFEAVDPKLLLVLHKEKGENLSKLLNFSLIKIYYHVMSTFSSCRPPTSNTFFSPDEPHFRLDLKSLQSGRQKIYGINKN